MLLSPFVTSFRVLPRIVQMPSTTPRAKFFTICPLPPASSRLAFFDVLSIPPATRSACLPRIARSISSRFSGRQAWMLSPQFARPLRFIVIDSLAVPLPPLALIDSIFFLRAHCRSPVGCQQFPNEKKLSPFEANSKMDSGVTKVVCGRGVGSGTSSRRVDIAVRRRRG